MFVSGTTATRIKNGKFRITIEHVRTRQDQYYGNSCTERCTYFKISE